MFAKCRLYNKMVKMFLKQYMHLHYPADLMRCLTRAGKRLQASVQCHHDCILSLIIFRQIHKRHLILKFSVLFLTDLIFRSYHQQILSNILLSLVFSDQHIYVVKNSVSFYLLHTQIPQLYFQVLSYSQFLKFSSIIAQTCTVLLFSQH